MYVIVKNVDVQNIKDMELHLIMLLSVFALFINFIRYSF